MSLKLKSINSENGLPVEQVHKIELGINNKLWLATSAGLVSYNGSEISVFDSRNGIECVGLRTVFSASNREMWIGTDKGIEFLNFDGEKKQIKFDFFWDFGIAECIFFFLDSLYVGTSYGLLKLQKKEESYHLINKWKIGFVRSIIKLDENSLLVSSSNKVLLKFTGKQSTVFCKDLPSNITILSLKKSVDGYFLLGTNEGLYIVDEKEVILECFILNESIKKVTAISTSGLDWWIAFGGTLVLIRFIKNTIKVIETIIVESTINDILIDSVNNVWLGTNNSGLKKLTALRSAIQHVNHGKEGAIYSIKKEQKQHSFIVCGDGSFARIKYNPITLKSKLNSDFKISTVIWDSCIDPLNSNKIWLATQDGIYVSENGESPHKHQINHTISNIPNRVFQVVGKTIFIGTIGGLFIKKNEEIKEVFDNNEKSLGYIYSLIYTDNDELWIGTLGRGIWVYKKDGICQITSEDLTSSGNTYAISINSNNSVAVLQDERLVIINSNLETKCIIKEHPVIGWAVVWTSIDTVAIGSTDGLILVDVVKNKIVKRINLHLSKSDWQFTFSKSLLMQDSRYLYCGLNSGIYCVDLKQIEVYSTPPKVFKSNIKWQNISPVKTGDLFTVAPGKWSLSVAVFSSWYIDESKVQYRFKMLGFDNDWLPLSNNFNIKYNSLPPGNYELQVQSHTPLTGFGSVKSLLKLIVVAPWWSSSLTPILDKSRAFYNRFFISPKNNKKLLEQNADLLIEIQNRKLIEQELQVNKIELEEVLKNYKLSKNELQKSNTSLRHLSTRLQNILEDEKKAIAREVHDVLGQRLTQLKLDASRLNNKLKMASNENYENTDKMIHVIDDTINIVRKIASELRPSILDDLGILAAIEWHAEAFEKLTDIDCIVEEYQLTESYSDAIKTAVFRIFQEALTNIIRHAKATLVIVRLCEEENLLVLEVEDNGIGIKDERKFNTSSLGLLGMRERVIILNGSFNITNTQHGGTLVRIEIPFTK